MESVFLFAGSIIIGDRKKKTKKKEKNLDYMIAFFFFRPLFLGDRVCLLACCSWFLWMIIIQSTRRLKWFRLFVSFPIIITGWLVSVHF